MKLKPNDPKITAYLLGELEEAEARALEMVLSEDEESRRYVEDLRETTRELVAEFARDPELALSPSQHREIEHVLSGHREPTALPIEGQALGGFFSEFFGWRFGVAISMAMVALVASVAFFSQPPLTIPRQEPLTVPELRDRIAKVDWVAPVANKEEFSNGAPADSLAQSQPPAAPMVESRESLLEQRRENLALIQEQAPTPAAPARSLDESRPQVAQQSDMALAPVTSGPVRKEPMALFADTRGDEAEVQRAATIVDLDEYVVDPDDRHDSERVWSETTTDGAAPKGPEGVSESLQRQLLKIKETSTLGVQLEPKSRELRGGLDPTVGQQLPQITQAAAPENRAYLYPNSVVSEGEQARMFTESGSLVLDSLHSQPGAGVSGGVAPSKGGLGLAPGLAPRVAETSNYSLAYPGTEDYEAFVENPFKSPLQEPLSTLSIDVDTASYANVRRFLNQGQLPPKDSIRIEEMINYFDYDYPQPTGEEPFSVQVEVSQCPWKLEHQLARLGIQGKEVAMDDRGPANLVFLLDVSGSMEPANKLPLVKQGMNLLLNQLQPYDRVAIVTYAGTSGIALPSTPCSDKPKIVAAIEALCSGGPTNGASGIELAYKTARQHFSDGGINRVILATDGDFNVGITDNNALVDLIQREAKSGVFLSVLGFGMGNLKDHKLESLADKGNGHYAYIETLQEAQKVLVDQLGGTLFTIAKDVKIQIEFNPGKVGAYRLIGYENRKLAAQDFNDDTKDAGEVGAGHSVTALYEIAPPGVEVTVAGIDPLKYQIQEAAPAAPVPAVVTESDDLMTVKLRYKQPDGQTSKKVEIPVKASEIKTEGSVEHTFAAAVAEFGMILRGSAFKGNANLDQVLDLARQGKGADEDGYRAEFLQLVKLAKSLSE